MPNIFSQPKTNMDAGTGVANAITNLFVKGPLAEKQAQLEAAKMQSEAAKMQSLINSQMLAGEKNAEETRGLRITNDLRDGTVNIEDYLAKANPNYKNLRRSELAALQGFTMLGKDMRNHSQSLNDYQEYYDREAIKSNPNLAPKINASYFAVKGSDPRMAVAENSTVSNLFGGGTGQVGVDGNYKPQAVGGGGGSYDVRGNAITPTSKAGKMQKAQLEAAKAQGDLNSLLDSMEANYGTLKSSGGIVSTDNRPKENAIASIQSNAYVGRPVGAFFGTKEESKRKEIDSARQSLLQAVMKATGMSAKSLDSNTELKIMLDSLGSPESDYESNVAIINRLRGLYGGKKMSGAPTRVDQQYWDAMPDEDKALWN